MTDFSTLKKRAKTVDKRFEKYKLAILGDCATQHIATALTGTAAIRGFALDVFDADYDQLLAQIMDHQSELYRFCPQAVLLICCTEKLYESYLACPAENRPSFAENTMQTILRYWGVLAEGSTAAILQFNFAYFNDAVLGSFALREQASFPYQLQKLNFLLSQAASSCENVFLIDLNGLQSLCGRDSLYDDKLYYMAKMPFSLEALPLIAQRTIDVVEALRGHVKKCVVADLDNTLWGGVIGDDGLEGIQIGELGTGHAFSDVQQWLMELKNRGILLAVCSKNNEDVAREPFEKHPDMILHLDDFAMFVANWEPKSSNILRIQQTLNIGLDSIVFLDDNPFEREQVRSMLPAVTVPELPEDPALYLRFLRGLNLFESASCSGTDAKRTEQYRQEAGRTALLSAYESYESYLQALDMRAVSAPFDPFNYPRIAQLTQRSNQFNLRTIRYTERQISLIARDECHITRCYSLKDKFGDYGLISVVILDRCPEDCLFISEWLMSCRVLKRGMEEFIINDILQTAKEHGYRRIVGEYIATPKNSMVADLYLRMGFLPDGERYSIEVSAFKNRTTTIKGESI